MELRFRPARAEDVPALVALLAADSLGRAREALGHEHDPAYLAAFEEIAADPRQELTVVEQDGELAGTFQLTRLRYLTWVGGERLLVEGVRVRPDLRGRGIGRRMFERIRERALELGCHLVQLTSDKRRTDARRFYESLGYVASHEGFKLHLERGE